MARRVRAPIVAVAAGLLFGCTPLYLGYEDVWHAVEHLRQVLAEEEWRRPEFQTQHAVT